MKTRIAITLIISALYFGLLAIFSAVKSPVSGAATAAQLDDTAASYVVAKGVSSNLVENCVSLVCAGLIVIVWLNPIKRNMKRIIPILLAAITLTGCKPVKVLDIKEIRPNETAWAIPLDGSSQGGQVKFNSVGFLDQKKVAAKRIMIDKVERKTGRFYWDIEWIPATRVITVDRSLITQTWTKENDIGVVTRDSVKLRVGLTITASIDEDDASTYLYYHGERPLADVMNQNIKSFSVAELTRKYGDLNLSDVQVKGTEIYNQLFEDAKVAFKAKGIIIQFLGNAEGLTYADESVQTGINKSYMAHQDAKTAEMEQHAQVIRNQTKILSAQAEAEAAQKLYAAQDATKFNNGLQIALLEAQARMKMAEKWSGNLPSSILPADSPLLLNIGAAGK